MSKRWEAKNPFTRFVKTIGFSSYYLVSKKSRTEQYEYFMANPDNEHLSRFFNLISNKTVNKLYKMNIPSIHLKQKFFVPMLASVLTMQECAKYEVGKPLHLDEGKIVS